MKKTRKPKPYFILDLFQERCPTYAYAPFTLETALQVKRSLELFKQMCEADPALVEARYVDPTGAQFYYGDPVRHRSNMAHEENLTMILYGVDNELGDGTTERTYEVGWELPGSPAGPTVKGPTAEELNELIEQLRAS